LKKAKSWKPRAKGHERLSCPLSENGGSADKGLCSSSSQYLINGTITFYMAVFANEKYAGNQLAVVRNAYKLPDTEMQRIARRNEFVRM